MPSDHNIAVKKSIERGDLAPASTHACVVCERQAQHYHHWSHDKAYALDVIPLCGPCHIKVGNGIIYLNVGAVEHVRPTYEMVNLAKSERPSDDQAPVLLSYKTVSFLCRLYGDDGHPDPDSVLTETAKESPGRIRIAIPSRVVRDELLKVGIIRAIRNGYMLDMERYPTKDFLSPALG